MNGTAMKKMTVLLNEEHYKTLSWYTGCKRMVYETTTVDAMKFLQPWLGQDSIDDIYRYKPKYIRFVMCN